MLRDAGIPLLWFLVNLWVLTEIFAHELFRVKCKTRIFRIAFFLDIHPYTFYTRIFVPIAGPWAANNFDISEIFVRAIYSASLASF